MQDDPTDAIIGVVFLILFLSFLAGCYPPRAEHRFRLGDSGCKTPQAHFGAFAAPDCEAKDDFHAVLRGK